jgi:hypothetical protein
MFLFFLGFIIFNFLVTAGYSDVFRLYSTRVFNAYAIGASVLIFVVLLGVPSIMREWIIGVFIYEIIGFSLYIKGCFEYIKKEKSKLNQY